MRKLIGKFKANLRVYLRKSPSAYLIKLCMMGQCSCNKTNELSVTEQVTKYILMQGQYAYNAFGQWDRAET
jgi:hypothetical protein